MCRIRDREYKNFDLIPYFYPDTILYATTCF